MIETHIKRFYKLLDHEEETELRCFKLSEDLKTSKREDVTFIHSLEEFVSYVKRMNKDCNVYAGLQERIKKGTKKEHVKKIKKFFIDVDTVNKPAKEEDIQEAEKITDTIIKDLEEKTKGRPTKIFTGNGFHLIYTIPEIEITKENWKEIDDKTQSFTRELIKKYSTEKVRLDNVGDLPRIIRVAGTRNHKGGKISLIKEQYDEPNSELRRILLEQKNEVTQLTQLTPITTLTNLSQKTQKDTSRSGKEFAEVCKLCEKGLSDDEIKEKMVIFEKWSESPESYKIITIKKAREKTLSGWIVYQCPKCGIEKRKHTNEKVFCEHETDHTKPKKYVVACHPVDFIEENTPEYVLNTVKSPDYFEKLTKELDRFIVGQEELKEVALTVLNGGRLVKNCTTTSYHLLFSALSGSGKDYFLKSLMKTTIPEGYYFHKTRMTEKYLSYMFPSSVFPYFTYDGKIIYSEDTNNRFLNCDTTKTFLSGGSNIGTVKDGYAVDIIIKGKPTFVFTSATAEPNAELLRRVSIVKTDTTKKQTERILSYQTEKAKKGEPKINRIILSSINCLRRVNVNVPFSDELQEKFSTNLNARTNYERLLDLIRASASLNQYNREKENGSITANREDLQRGIRVFLTLYNDSSIPLTSSQEAVYTYMKESESEHNAQELFNIVGCKHYTQINNLIKGLNSLSQKGLVSIHEGDRNNRPTTIYKAQEQELDLTKLRELLDDK